MGRRGGKGGAAGRAGPAAAGELGVVSQRLPAWAGELDLVGAGGGGHGSGRAVSDSDSAAGGDDHAMFRRSRLPHRRQRQPTAQRVTRPRSPGSLCSPAERTRRHSPRAAVRLLASSSGGEEPPERRLRSAPSTAVMAPLRASAPGLKEVFRRESEAAFSAAWHDTPCTRPPPPPFNPAWTPQRLRRPGLTTTGRGGIRTCDFHRVNLPAGSAGGGSVSLLGEGVRRGSSRAIRKEP